MYSVGVRRTGFESSSREDIHTGGKKDHSVLYVGRGWWKSKPTALAIDQANSYCYL